eukprot:3382860-Rhodomonas_salina.2
MLSLPPPPLCLASSPFSGSQHHPGQSAADIQSLFHSTDIQPRSSAPRIACHEPLPPFRSPRPPAARGVRVEAG